MRHHFPRPLCLVAASLLPVVLPAQGDADSLRVEIAIDTGRYLPNTTPIEIRLHRVLRPDEGALVLMVGGVDVTGLAERLPTGLRYRPGVEPLPHGQTEVVAYRTTGAAWIELQRVTVKVLTAGGFRRIEAQPQGTLTNKGQLTSSTSGMPEPERPRYQDFAFNGSLGTTHEHEGFTLESSTNLVGASRREEALRYGLRQDAAPRLDLSDYRVSLRTAGTTVVLGHTSFGASRHLVNGFGARGATIAWTRGGTTLGMAAMGAASTVGWDQLLPVSNGDHRVLAVSLGRELLPTRPGALRVDGTWLDASMLPRGGFTQGAVIDAEASDGGSLQFSAATPGQRLRLTSGVSRSRFVNPLRDSQLGADTLLVAMERETNTARFVEASLTPVQGRTLPGIGAVQAAVTMRHERVDPLYRSVVAPVQADRQQDGGDLTLTLGALNGQVTVSRSRDNLTELPGFMTTRDRVRTTSLAAPLAQLLGVTQRAAWLPTVSWSLNRTHQAGDGVPEGGIFTPDQVPDQLSRNRDLGAQWQVGTWRVGVRSNRAHQDNRQVGRAAADFASGSDALSIGSAFGSAADVSLDLGDDFQESLERSERSTTRRATLNANLRRGQSTSLMVAFSLLRTTPPTGPVTLNTDQRVEITQPLTVLKDASGGARGQLFLRFGRTTARVPDFARQESDPLAVQQQRQWMVNSGFNLRVF
ncbi:MAG: hypothetical protein IPK85_05170 [Gemmatimonadetes bacterium]|nr:hypothetical protein [Gemmatimonadota bacterium]